MIGVSTATEIRLSPDNGDIQKWCLVTADIFIDTENNKVAATDVVLQSSLEYIDFVPTKNLFPYFFPPKVKNNAVHIVWFIADPKNTITGSGIIGKLFFRQKTGDVDGVIKMFFAGKWQTQDSNLSILWWIDVLDTVGSWYYRFLDDAPCQYPADYVIEGWFSHMSAEDMLNQTIKQIRMKEWLKNLFSRKTLIEFSWLLIIIAAVFIYLKKRKIWKK